MIKKLNRTILSTLFLNAVLVTGVLNAAAARPTKQSPRRPNICIALTAAIGAALVLYDHADSMRAEVSPAKRITDPTCKPDFLGTPYELCWAPGTSTDPEPLALTRFDQIPWSDMTEEATHVRIDGYVVAVQKSGETGISTKIIEDLLSPEAREIWNANKKKHEPKPADESVLSWAYRAIFGE